MIIVTAIAFSTLNIYLDHFDSRKAEKKTILLLYAGKNAQILYLDHFASKPLKYNQDIGRSHI